MVRGGPPSGARLISSTSGPAVRGPSWSASGANFISCVSASSMLLHVRVSGPLSVVSDPDPSHRHKQRYVKRPSGSLMRMHSGDESRRFFLFSFGTKLSDLTSSHLGMVRPRGEAGGVSPSSEERLSKNSASAMWASWVPNGLRVPAMVSTFLPSLVLTFPFIH